MTLLDTVEKVARWSLRRAGVRSRMLETPAGQVHLYDVKGEGALPPLVILHGIGSSATSFAPLLLGLRKHFSRILAPDAPAHGFSDAPPLPFTVDTLAEVITHVLDRELGGPGIVLGNSLGGAMAIRYALARPRHAHALILSSPGGAMMTEEEWVALRRSFEFASRRDATRFLARLYHEAPWFTPLLGASVEALFARGGVRSILETVTTQDLLTPEQLASLQMPTLMLWGRSEKLLPDASREWFRTHLPRHVVFEEPEDFGHCPNLDRPGLLMKRVVQFARELPPAR